MNRDYIVAKIAEDIKNKNDKELKRFIEENLSDMIEKEYSKTINIYDGQDKSGEGIYVYVENDNVYIDCSLECGYAGDSAEIPIENFRVLFADEFAELKAENENLKKLLSIAKGD